MGQFSWIYSDTKKPMLDGVIHDSYLLVPEPFQAKYGKFIKEKCYEGYGEMGGYDVYELVVEWNRDSLCKEYLRYPHIGEQSVKMMMEYKNGASDSKMENLYRSEWKRYIGIDIACYDEQNRRLKYPIKIVENPDYKPYEFVEPSDSDPNQGWGCE